MYYLLQLKNSFKSHGNRFKASKPAEYDLPELLDPVAVLDIAVVVSLEAKIGAVFISMLSVVNADRI
jgi:hypothetical protein